MKKEMFIDNKIFTSESETFLPKAITVSSTTDEKFKKEQAMQMWAKIFDNLKIEYLHSPSICVDRKEYTADFYLKTADTFVFVKGYAFDEEDYSNNEPNILAKEIERNVIVAYTDGKFRVVDFYDHQERLERDEVMPEEVYLSSEAMFCKCRKCNNYFVTTNYGWWGCRTCGFYDGNNTAKDCYLGDEGFGKLND